MFAEHQYVDCPHSSPGHPQTQPPALFLLGNITSIPPQPPPSPPTDTNLSCLKTSRIIFEIVDFAHDSFILQSDLRIYFQNNFLILVLAWLSLTGVTMWWRALFSLYSDSNDRYVTNRILIFLLSLYFRVQKRTCCLEPSARILIQSLAKFKNEFLILL